MMSENIIVKFLVSHFAALELHHTSNLDLRWFYGIDLTTGRWLDHTPEQSWTNIIVSVGTLGLRRGKKHLPHKTTVFVVSFKNWNMETSSVCWFQRIWENIPSLLSNEHLNTLDSTIQRQVASCNSGELAYLGATSSQLTPRRCGWCQWSGS
jgi:hypothetical protein